VEPTSPTAGLVLGGDASRYGLKAAAAGPATSTDPTLVGAGYLVRELAAGDHVFSVVVPDFGTFPDYGVTADAVLALDAAGAGQDEATLATTELAKHAVDYIGFGDKTEIAIGATAKLLLLSLAQGVDPRAFGGYDLVATLQGREQVDGHFTDQTKYSDGSNVFGQSLALMALDRGGFPVSAAAVSFLRDQQCTDGGFRLFYAQPNDPPACSSDPDATAMAVQALIAVAGSSDADAVSGLNFLAARQTASGGIGGGGPQTGINANTTGLAGQAFLAGGRSAQARLATSYLSALQYGCDFPAALRGGIAYDQVAYDAQAGLGSAAQPQDQDRRSTSQALLALAGTPLYAVSATGADATAPQLACAAATTSTTTSSTTSSSTSTSTGGGSNTSAPADPAAAPAASANPGNLAFTGSNVAAMVLLAVLLLGTGAVALVVARRKGAHA
jgi:hypothetical protein